MKTVTLMNLSIIFLLFLGAVLIYYGLLNYASSLGAVDEDKLFEYSVLFFVYLSVVLFLLRIAFSFLFLSPLQRVSKLIYKLRETKQNDAKNREIFVPKEFQALVNIIKSQDEELKELSMAFEASVEKSTQALALSNEKLNSEKEFAHKIIEKLHDIVFVVKENTLVYANNHFYTNFQDLARFIEYSKANSLSECLELLTSEEYFEVAQHSYSVNVELFNDSYYMITLIDMTQYRQSIKYAQDQNPLTKLPGNESIKKFMYTLLKTKEAAVVIYFDFDNFKPFNDKYGFELGDKMISSFANIMISKEKSYNMFNAHIGGDDFFSCVKEPYDLVISMTNEMVQSFKNKAKELYSQEDIDNGYVVLNDRNDEKKKFPLLSVSAVVLNISPNAKTVCYTELTKIIASMKKVSKGEKNKIAAASLIV